MQLNNEPGSKINVRLPLNNKILKYTNNNIINYKIIFYEKLDRIFGCYIEFSSESKQYIKRQRKVLYIGFTQYRHM